jgi:hypothetical protein
VIFRRRLHHPDSGPRRATVWLRRRDAGPQDFKVVRTATSTRFFEGRHHAGKDPAVDEALEYANTADKDVYDAYLIVTWEPHVHAGASIGGCDPREEDTWKS